MASSTPASPTPGSVPSLPRAVWVIAGALLVVLVALAGAYGFHRDEMYFILAGRHPDFGYVDQPPLTPLLTAAAAQILGSTPFAVRLLPSIVTALGAVLCADMARRFGASGRAQILAALLFASSGLMGLGHLDVTATFDVFGWTVALWLLVRLLASERPGRQWRRWLALGLVIGIALENKTMPVFLGASLAGGVLLARRWEIVRAPAMWAAVALAMVIWAPNLVWQAQHGFPQLEMADEIAAAYSGLGDRIWQLVILLLMAGPFVIPLTLAGLVWLVRAPEARAWRPIGYAALIDVGLMFALAGRDYYAAGFIPVVLAAAATALDRRLSVAGVGLKLTRLAPALVGSAVTLALLTLPLVPPAELHNTPIPDMYAESVAQIGWPELAAQVETVVNSLTPADRREAVILTAGYGQYGALNVYGHNLPPIYSGQNSVWYWGQPPDGAGPVILVGQFWQPPSVFQNCHAAATVDNGYDLPTEEQGTPIWVCGGTTMPWSEIWPALKHID